MREGERAERGSEQPAAAAMPSRTHRHAVPGTHRVALAGLELDRHVLRQHRVQPVVALDVVLRRDLKQRRLSVRKYGLDAEQDRWF